MHTLVSLVHLDVYHIYLHIVYISCLLCICIYVCILIPKNTLQYISSGLPKYYTRMSKRTLSIQRRMFVTRLTLCTVVPITEVILSVFSYAYIVGKFKESMLPANSSDVST